MSDTSIAVTRILDATPDAIFDVLSNPERHHEIDGSGTVVSDDHTDRVQAVGDVFRMNMSTEAMGDYQTDNHVIGFDQNKLIAWKTAPAGEEPPGWQWVWELNATDSSTTEVTLSYDWSAMDPKLAQKLGMPVISHDDLEASLKKLGATAGP
ncbi:MAG: SRPBCC family protein [Brevibacterium yomogidense]|uniref:Activator of Hsp90 ATPase homologue 1/2-like C-terminal domain-containing protein n=1 Tax=Brevibacterium yomogidense TaxID=946573 RepID=A0A1X6X8X6_9MICO|nr:MULTISPECIES: SRPBCC family protein [Brevibacterium]SLM95702.1 hypothetical protein FM105_05010 [Brevibacterium yomogidense]SMX65236.1 Activator of Hsp90 ATPase homolog 1-like protein [Brevibacterium sp. Mu109]